MTGSWAPGFDGGSEVYRVGTVAESTDGSRVLAHGEYAQGRGEQSGAGGREYLAGGSGGSAVRAGYRGALGSRSGSWPALSAGE
jgi:hypothetical protein